MMRAVSGEVPSSAQVGLSAAKQELGYFLACVCRPTGDLEVARVEAAASTEAHIASVTRTTGNVLIVRLQTTSPLGYRAGQFMTLLREDGLARAYSLASVSGIEAEDELVLHVRHYPKGAMSGWLADVKPGTRVTLSGPYGECFYVADDLDRPLLLVGSGTGLAPLYGIVREALRAGHRGPIRLLYGARRGVDLYHREELRVLAAAHANLEITASVLEAGEAVDVVETALDVLAIEAAKAVDTRALRAYLCGDPALVTGLRRKLFMAGMSMASIFADAFLPAASASTPAAV